MKLIPADIDHLPYGTMVYDAGGVALGVVERYFEMNGNYRAKERRHINTGKWTDRFAYRRSGLYRQAKESGVFVVAPKEIDQ